MALNKKMALVDKQKNRKMEENADPYPRILAYLCGPMKNIAANIKISFVKFSLLRKCK
jgi:hypothetical protein